MTSEKKGEKDYSISFSHEKGRITTQFYDMDKGELADVTYVWDEQSSRFIQ